MESFNALKTEFKKSDPVAYMRESVKPSRKKRGPVWSDVYAHEAEERLDAHHGVGWFNKLTKDQQLAYLKIYPASKYRVKT